jgi:hypothetical protein
LAQLFYLGFFLLCISFGLFHVYILADFSPSIIFHLNPYPNMKRRLFIGVVRLAGGWTIRFEAMVAAVLF